MLTLTELINKKLIDSTSGMDFGTITNGCLVDGIVALVTTNNCLLCQNVMAVGDVIMAKNCVENAVTTPMLNKHVYTTNGTHLGRIADIKLTKKCKATTICCSYPITIGKIVSMGDVVVVRFSPKAPQLLPDKLYGNSDFLVGKLLTNNIVDYQGEVLYRVGHKIDNLTLTNCKKLNLLRQLIIYSQ